MTHLTRRGLPRRVPRLQNRHAAPTLMAALALGLCLPSAARAQHVEDYPRLDGGEWVRGPNITGPEGQPTPRQEHAVGVLNGFLYGINGLIPTGDDEVTANEPDAELFAWGRATTVYVPPTHRYARESPGRSFRHLGGASLHPTSYHHMIATVHQGRLWTFGGHVDEFEPTDAVYVFTPASPESPEGTWSGLRVEDGEPCALPPPHLEEGGGEGCLRLPEARAAGAAVSVDGGIYLLGGVVDNEDPRDLTNEAIRPDERVYFLDTSELPLRWQEMPSMNEARGHFTAVVVGGRIYAIGGRTAEDTRMRGVESWALGVDAWRQEQPAPVGGSAGIVAAVGECIYSFGGEFTPLRHTGTLLVSQVFHVPSGVWRTLHSRIESSPLDATEVLQLQGVFGAVLGEAGAERIFVLGGGDQAWGSPISKTHSFTPPESCVPSP
jgi:hypothetical protein